MTGFLESRHVTKRQHGTIVFGEDTVTKTAAPHLMRIEIEKTQRALEISRRCGCFRVPRVLDFDEDAGVAVFERFHGIKAAGTAIHSRMHGELLAGILATALAIIHRELQLPSDMVCPLPSELSSHGNDVFIHGDLSTENVCFDERDSSIVIFDWQMTGMHGGRATYGTRYFDVVWFINNLIYRPRLRYLFGNPLASIMRKFIRTYFEEAAVRYDKDGFSHYVERFFRTKRYFGRTCSSRRERLLLWRSHDLADMFVHSLATIG